MPRDYRSFATIEASRVFASSSGDSAPFDALVDALTDAYRFSDRVGVLEARLSAIRAISYGHREETLPGWRCPQCGTFNGEAKASRARCRHCEASL